MSITISVSQHHHSPISATPFVMLPISIMEHQSLSSGAKYLYACLKRHARQKGFCWPSIGLLCKELQASPNTVRKYMRELVAAGLVSVRRRGQGRTSLYTLHPEKPVRMVKTTLPEAQNLRIEEDEKEKEGVGDFEISKPKLSVDFSSDTGLVTEKEQDPKPSSFPIPAPQLDEARMAIFPFISDISRELRDFSSLASTTTRAVRLYRKANVSIEDFQTHLLVARQTTQERSASIKKSRQDGVKVKVPYFFAVLEQSLGLRQSSDFDRVPYPQSQSGTAYSTAYHTNPMVQGTRDFWNDRE
jgi:DNA-binding transcriptional ArsR family regulator